LAAEGATIAESPADLATQCAVVLTMLLDAKAVAAVYQGPQGILSVPLTGKLIVDLSTAGAASALAVGAAVTAAGADYVECPVGGTVAPALNGQLLGLAGGSDAAVARAKPLLDQLCRRLVHAGPVGAGATLKLSVNLPLLVYWEALGEALALMARQGMTAADLVDVMADTPGTAAVLALRRTQVVAGMTTGDAIPVAFELRGALKDLGLMVEAGRAMGLEMPVAEAARAAYARTAEAGGAGADASEQSLAAWRQVQG
jgi:3-hydroxyisobutyrate dehydrogenase